MNKTYFQPEYRVIAILIMVKLIIHILLNMNSGFDGDEILHIDCGNHLAWGYMSIQPFIGFLGWIQNLMNSQSVFVHHLFAHVAAILIMVYSGLVVMKLGGGWKAVLLALTCIVVAPGFSLSQHLFTPLVFEQLFWLLSIYMLIIYCKDNHSKNLLYLAVFLALGFMTKISILIFIAAIGISILIYRSKLLTQKAAWFSLAVFLLIISPNIIWQYQHDFPSVGHMIALHGKMLINIDIIENLKLLFVTTNPFTAVVWLTGVLLAPFILFARNLKLALATVLISFLILMIFRGQFYYYFPALLIALCYGSVIIENYLKNRKKLLGVYVLVLFVSGIFLTPKVIPILPMEKYIEHLNLDHTNSNNQLFFNQQSIADNKNPNTDQRIPIAFEAYYTHNDWIRLTETIHNIYQDLPQEKRNNCFIWTRCYTQASAINLHGKDYKLPMAFSQHGNCYEWIPDFDRNATIIAVANAKSPADSIRIASFFAPSFENINWKQAVFCPYSRTSSNAYYMLYLGDGLKYNSDSLKVRYKDYIFE